MNFSDIFKSSFLENVGSVSILDMIITLVLSFAIGLFIFMVYKKTYNGVMYSSSFGVTLIAIKEPLDIAFLFWSIAVGIILAAGFLPLAVIGSVVIGIVLLVFVNKKSHLNPYMVVVSCADYEAEMAVRDFLAKQVQKSVIKSKTAQKHSIELNIEVRMKDENTDFINILSEMKGVNSAVLVSYNGDYMG